MSALLSLDRHPRLLRATAPARRLFWDLLRLPKRLAFRRELSLRHPPFSGGGPAVHYGGALEHRKGEPVAGGYVKLQHLAQAFPEQESFNLLYLVSSASPPDALELVRWAQARGAKFVWNQNGVAFPAWAGARTPEVNAPMAELLHRADFVIYQSAFCQESADHFLGRADSPSCILFNPVCLDAFSPAGPPPPGCWRLLTAGTHYQAARVLAPLEALATIRRQGQNAHLTIAGALRWPGGEEEVRATICRLGVQAHVTLRPAFDQIEAVHLYRESHLLLHPKYHDPCPTVVIEALACGVPVIGSRSGGLPELIGDDGGKLLEVPLGWDVPAPLDPTQIAAAVARLMAGWAEHSRTARARAIRLFDASAWISAHRQIFASLLAP